MGLHFQTGRTAFLRKRLQSAHPVAQDIESAQLKEQKQGRPLNDNITTIF